MDKKKETWKIKLARKIAKRNKASTIEGNIRFNNKSMNILMLALVIFAALNLLP